LRCPRDWRRYTTLDGHAIGTDADARGCDRFRAEEVFMPTVRVLYFSSLRLALGRDDETFVLPAKTTAHEILRTIAEAHPERTGEILGARLAVNREFSQGEVHLHDGAELAVITPVSGG
jgi:molybdopterin converting factor small subunit